MIHRSHLLPNKMGGVRPQNHYTTRFAKKIQEMPRAGLSYRGKAPSSYNLSVSLRSTAPLVGEPLAKPFTLRGLPKPLPLGEVSPKVTERASPAGKSRCAAMGRLFVRAMLSQCLGFVVSGLALSVSLRSPALPKGEPLPERAP